MMRKYIVALFLGWVLLSPKAMAQVREDCSFSGPSLNEGQTFRWSFPTGTKLKGEDSLDLDGDGIFEYLSVIAEVQRDYSVDVRTKKRSDTTYCWFRTQLDIRRSEGSIMYHDEWSIKYDDMPRFLDEQGAVKPEEYFVRFARLKGMHRSGVDSLNPKERDIDLDAIKWSLESQEIKDVAPQKILEELSKVKNIRTFVYLADWAESIRTVAYVPSIRRGVTIQIRY